MENRFCQLPQKHVIIVLAISVLVLVYLAYGVGHFGAQRRHWKMAAADVPIGQLEADERPIGFRLGIHIDLPASSSKQKFHVGMTKSIERPTSLTRPPLAADRKWLSRDASEYDVTNSSLGTMAVADERLIVRDNTDEDEARQTVYRTFNKDTWTAKRKLPQALIIGVKKGGTRALLEFIRLHPDVRAVGPETHFFDRNYHKGLDWYRRHMPASLEGQITMEKTPSYFVTREVPRRVHNMSRDARLLVVVRDPVTRAISDYAQTMSKRNDLKPFEELAFRNNVTGLVDTSWAAIKLGVYAKHLERWLQYFPLRQFHFVSGERLIKDPAGEMTKVQDFLGIRRVITDDHFYFNETKGFPCLKKSERNGRPKCLGRTKGRPHPNIDSAAIQRLRDFYRPFNVKFYLMTGVNFEWP